MRYKIAETIISVNYLLKLILNDFFIESEIILGNANKAANIIMFAHTPPLEVL